MGDAYEQAYREALDDPRRFWARAAEDVEWLRRSRAVLNDADPLRATWFPGAKLNTCANALDLHVAGGRGEQAALVYDSAMTGEVRSFSYAELLDRVARFAGALAGLGVERGDRVLIYMPMVPEAVIGMLACARLGAIHSVVFGGFAPDELAQRIQHAAPRVVLAASCGLEPGRVVEYMPMLEAAIERVSHKPQHCVVLQRPQAVAKLRAERDHDWAELAASAEPVGCTPVEAKDPLYILYTSGTTGMPKGVVRLRRCRGCRLRLHSCRVVADAASGVADAAGVSTHPLRLGCRVVVDAASGVADAAGVSTHPLRRCCGCRLRLSSCCGVSTPVAARLRRCCGCRLRLRGCRGVSTPIAARLRRCCG